MVKPAKYRTVRSHEFEESSYDVRWYCKHCKIEVDAYVRTGGRLGTIFGRLLVRNRFGNLVVPSRVRCRARQVAV